MKKIKNLIFGLSAILIASGISGCSLQKGTDQNSISKIEFESDIDVKHELSKKIITPGTNELFLPTLPSPTPTPATSFLDIEETNIAERKLVALTFDDGPSKYTEELLTLLDEYDVKATFFVVGYNCEYYPDTLSKIADAGHEIAIHGETHTAFTELGIEQTNSEITNTINYIESLEIDVSNLVRPPYGSLNNDLKENIEYPFICWNIDTEDWKTKDKEQIEKQILDNIQEGSIILMHDTKAVHEVDMEVLKEILPNLTSEYNFVTISELCEKHDVELENGKVYRKIKSEN